MVSVNDQHKLVRSVQRVTGASLREPRLLPSPGALTWQWVFVFMNAGPAWGAVPLTPQN